MEFADRFEIKGMRMSALREVGYRAVRVWGLEIDD